MNKLNFLTLVQSSFFNHLINSNFKQQVLKRANLMGLDGAFYFSIGEKQSETNNFSFDELTDEKHELFINAIIIEFPELEF